MLENILKELGFTDKESLVYLTCLKLGSQPVSVIAKKAELKRTTTYVILEDLSSQGLMSQYLEKNLRYFSATDPDNLLNVLQSKKDEWEKKEQILKSSLGDFHSLINPHSVNPKVRFFEGVKGIEYVMEDTLSAKGTLNCYTTMDGWFARNDLKDYISRYCAKRVKKKVPLRSIMTDTPVARKYLADYPKNKTFWSSRWLPKDINSFTNEINIYDDKVAICCLDGKELLGIIIESRAISQTQLSIFELAWIGANK